MPSLKILIALSLLSLFAACGGGGGGSSSGGNNEGSEGEEPMGGSGNGGGNANTSHNAGENCMSGGCHDGSSNDADEFFVGGTILRSNGAGQTNATITLYIHNTNTVAATLETDDSGNFWTTEMVDGLSINGETVTGVDVVVSTNVGNYEMPGLITTGACYGCHGVDVGNIVAN